jgi:hypothetical protein
MGSVMVERRIEWRGFIWRFHEAYEAAVPPARSIAAGAMCRDPVAAVGPRAIDRRAAQFTRKKLNTDRAKGSPC